MILTSYLLPLNFSESGLAEDLLAIALNVLDNRVVYDGQPCDDCYAASTGLKQAVTLLKAIINAWIGFRELLEFFYYGYKSAITPE